MITLSARPVYSINSEAVPFPAALAPLLRPDSPQQHYAAVLREIFDRQAKGRYGAQQVTALDRLRRLIERNLLDDAAAHYVQLLVPVAPCRRCGRLFLAETERRAHCSDGCRREFSS